MIQKSAQLRSIQDPFGHTILASSTCLATDGCHTMEELEQIISNPAFTIQVKSLQTIYFFRTLDWEVNVMLEVKQRAGHFAVEAFRINPTAEFISDLLSNGTLNSFT